MKVHLITKHTVENYVLKNDRSKNSMRFWQLLLKGSDWNKPSDILNTFGNADMLGNGSCRVVFDIGGNNYRVICYYFFGEKQVHLFICWIGTHAEYTFLCNKNNQYTV